MKQFLLAAVMAAMLGVAAVPASAAIVYDNTNGFANAQNVDGWNITTPYIVADSFSFGSATTVTGVNFWVWEFARIDDLTSVDWSFVSTPNTSTSPIGGTSFANGTAATTGLLLGQNGQGFINWKETISIPGVTMAPGTTYWLLLQNGQTTDSKSVFWDQSDGPSTAFESPLGALADPTTGHCANGGPGGPSCSETFQLVGNAATPEPGTMVLFGSGLLMLAGAIRRKVAR